MATIGKNQFFEIKNGDGSSFHNLVLRKSAVESIVMSLGDKISGDVYYKDNTLSVTMHEYITYNGVNYMLVNPPTIVKEGVVSDNSELKGMTKYSFVFYHPMCLLSNFPFTDVAVTSDETRYLSESKVFSWIGKPADFVAKMNKNLVGTEWIVELSSRFPQDKLNELSDVIPFDNATIADACKIFYDTWGVPYVVDKVASTETSYAAGKRFKLVMGLPSNEIYENAQAEQQNTPFVFQMGQGVGLKNNSRTPRNNKIITRISGYGSENNIPYGYPQVRWYGTAGQAFTYGDHAGVYNNVTIEGVHFDKIISYPIYKGILDGEYVELIKHPFTRTHLMPSVYRTTLFNKISFYDAAGEANTDYDPDITLVDYYDAVYSAQYPYPNTINLQAPSYESHEFEDEKPELGEAHIISATPLNNDLTPASSWDDSLDDEGNYKQSYFQMVLPQLSFDLYACASITEEMQINMRSGACLGCTFTVQVDWDDYKRNFYDDEGNFAPNGSQRDLTKYPKSNQGSISLILQKDNSTFGTLMPNMYQYPKGETSTGAADGDTFVILGISLPESYIFAAEWRLDADMKSYMLENNVHYFDYPLKFDEDFLFHKEYILSQIRPNTIVRFNYAGQTQALFVKQITIKYGEQALPQYDITLTDNVEVVLNQIGQVAEDVEKLSTLIAILRQSYGKNVWNELAKKLSKTQNDTAAGYITMLKGLQVGANFVPDILGEGGCLRMRQDGKVELVTDILYARMRAYFDSVVIREYKHESGNRIKSPAQGFNASRVENIKVVDNVETIVDDASEADFFRCYWRIDDGEKKAENQFVVGDLAFCEHSDIVNGSLVTKRYWRVVTGRNAGNTTTADGEAWIDLSNAKDGSGNPVMTTITYEGQGGTTQTKSVLSFESGSGYPEAHDDICMLGCTTDTTRQGAIIEYVSGVDAPTYQIYQGLGADATNPYVLTNKNQISLGYSTSTGKAYMNVYGDTYIGDRNRNTFLEYKQSGAGGNPELNIKAKVQILPNGSTIDGQSIPDYIKDNQNNYDDTEVQQAISDLNNAIDNLQDQIDGSIETLYGDVDPSVPANDPYKDYTVDEKEKHLGDMYYNSTTGYAYRYDKSVEGEGEQEVTTYFWQIIRDTGITQAIADAAAALGLADTKAKIFTTTAGTLPTPPYKINDVWVNATYPANGSTYSNEILKCVTARAQGATANISDWAKASKYTDDSSLNNFISATYNPTINGLNEQIDRKIESWFQSTDPSAAWYDDTQTPVLDVRADHVGDMWYSESTHLLKRYDSETTGEGEQAVTTYFWTTIQDQKAIDAYDNAAHAQDTADGKRRVFTAQPVAADAYDVGDLWVNATYPATGTKTYENDVLRCKTAKAAGVAFDIAHWQKASKYTDDSAFNSYIDEMLNGSQTSGSSSIIAAATQRAIMSALGGSTIIAGGLMLTSMIALRQNTGTAETPQYTTWAGISGIYDNTLSEQDEYVGVKGHGIAAWYGGAKVDLEDKSNYWTEEQIAAWEALTDEQKAESPLAAKSLFRMDGSGYLATANISWNDRGQITIKNITTLSDSQNTNLLNELATFNSAFKFATDGEGSTTAVYVKPQVPFESLYIGTSNANKKEVATQEWVGTYYISKSWFNKFFKVHYKNNGTDAVLDPNNDFPAGATDKNIEAIFSFWTNYAISALGQGVDGSHAIGSLDDLSDVELTSPATDQILKFNGTHWVNAAAPQTYVLPQATANALGGIKIGYNDATPKTYAVALNSAGQAYVAVPWENTTYTLAGLMGSTAIGGATQPIYWNGSAFANTTYTLGKSVPSDALFTDHTYTNGTGLALSSGTFSINSTYQTYISHGESAYNSLSNYVKLDGGTTEQTIKNSISSLSKGVINLWRSNGDYYTFLGFSNGTTETYIGGIGFKSQSDHNLYRKDSSNYYKIWDENNDGSGSGLDADLLDGTHKADLFSSLTSNSSTLLSITIGGTNKTLSTLYASHAAQLTTSCSLWGNSFNGTSGITSSIIISTSKTGESDKYIQIGDIKLVYDSSNEAIKVVHTVANKVASLWAEGGIAALGSTGSGGGGGGQGDVTWDLLKSSDTRQINISHLAGDANYAGVMSILTGYTTSGQNYKVQEDANHHLYVNVPWSNTTYTNGTGLALSSNQFSINSTYQTYISHGESAYNSLSSYLPLSGGTLSNAHFGGALTIERSGSTNFAAIGFKNSNGMLGYLAVNTVNASFVRYCIDTDTSYTILDSSNSSVSLSGSTLTVKINGTSQSLTNTNTWRGMQNNLTTTNSSTTDSLSAYQGYLLANGYARDSTKLPLTGGTITMSTVDALKFSKTINDISVVRFDGLSNGDVVNFGYLGFLGANNPVYRNTNGSQYKLWNESNDGSGSGLDADLLDGHHASYFATAASLGDYLPLSGGTLTGQLTVATSLGIADASGWGLLAYHPTTWIGVSSTQWGVGTYDCEGVIRTSASALKHYRGSDGTYDIIDSKGGQTIANNLTVGANNNDYLQIGGIRLVYDSSNTALKVIKSDGTAANFYATGGIAALGSTGSGGGGGQGDVTWELLVQSDTRQINISHLAGDANYAGVMSILTGYTTSGKNYKVQEDSNHHLYVNVPWTDNNTTYSNGTGLSLSSNTFSISSTYQTYISHGESAYNSLSDYVKLDGGTNEQTIKNSISSLSKGVINLWRNSGDYYTFLGFSNGTTETYLGGIGFKSQSDHNLYRKDSSNYYKIWDENNDGSGSGLDADLLDGYHASYFAINNTRNIVAGGYYYSVYSSLSANIDLDSFYVKQEATEQTITSTIGSYQKGVVEFYRASNAISFISFANNNGSGTKRTLGAIGFEADGVNDLKFRTTDGSHYKIWNAYNDGSGSGLDADLLDGQHGSYYAAASSLNNYLPLTGGTLSLGTVDSFIIKKTSNNLSYVRYEGLVSGSNTILGFLGFAGVNTPSFRDTSSTDYTLWHAGNYTNWLNTTNYPGLNSVNTDYQVQQNITSSTNAAYRPLICGASYSYSETPIFSTTTSSVYALHAVFVQPSTGNLYLYNSTGGDSPALYFQRGDLSTSGTLDWRMYVTSGNMVFQNDSNGWSDFLKLDNNGYVYLTGHNCPQASHSYYLGTSSYVWEKAYVRYIDTDSGYNLRICQAGTERISVVNGTGYVGINQTSPSYALDVTGSIRATSTITGDTFVVSNTNAVGHLTFSRGSYNYINCSASGGKIGFITNGYGIGAANCSLLIDSNGCVGIGTKSPSYKLHVAGTGYISSNFCVSGNVGIGTTSPSYKLHVNGESYFENWMYVNSSVTAQGYELKPSSSSAGHGGHIDFHFNQSSADYTTRLIEDASGRLKLIGDFYATGGVTALVATSSDIRKKNVVSYDLPLTLNQIADAPTIKFTWKDKPNLGEQVGSIAQYWQKVLPQTIRTEKDDTLSLQYGVAALVAAITTARKVVDHEREIAQLKERVSALEKENELLKLKIA